MVVQSKIILAAVLGFSLASSALASDHRGREDDGAVPSTTVLVRLHKVTGLNADNREQVLYASDHGQLVPLNDLAQVGAHLQADQGVADGVYHDLQIELANDIVVQTSGREPLHTQFKPDGSPTVLRMLGTVVFANGEVQPRSLALDTGRMSEAHDERGAATRDGSDGSCVEHDDCEDDDD